MSSFSCYVVCFVCFTWLVLCYVVCFAACDGLFVTAWMVCLVVNLSLGVCGIRRRLLIVWWLMFLLY